MKKKFLDSSINLITRYKEYTKDEIAIVKYGLESIYLIITKAIIIFGIAIFLGILKETPEFCSCL